MSRILRSCVTSSISEWKLESKRFLQEVDVLALFSNFKGVDVLTDGESFNFFASHVILQFACMCLYCLCKLLLLFGKVVNLFYVSQIYPLFAFLN